jgi:hypothetical protein
VDPLLLTLQPLKRALWQKAAKNLGVIGTGNTSDLFQPAVNYPVGDGPLWIAMGDFNGLFERAAQEAAHGMSLPAGGLLKLLQRSAARTF